ncbi:MAG TPA: RES domain-containing protein [Thermoanaerobaculia bacterium]|nr:RES domain-containing protein [Thermoanaerobaculia bacterium]
MSLRRLPFEGSALYRVIRAGWRDPLDASFSRRATDNRWNTSNFAALYCCGSLFVARAVTRDILRLAGVDIEDLLPDWRPRLVEIGWHGDLVDVATPEGIAAAGYSPSYPADCSKEVTRRDAERWHRDGEEGVTCRSASLWRMGFVDWTGSWPRWSEITVFVESCRTRPSLLDLRADLA